MKRTAPAHEIEYPESDGRPMGEKLQAMISVTTAQVQLRSGGHRGPGT